MFRNYQLEDLLKQLTEAKKRESEKYFDDIANNVIGGGNQPNGDVDVDMEDTKSPIERVSLGLIGFLA